MTRDGPLSKLIDAADAAPPPVTLPEGIVVGVVEDDPQQSAEISAWLAAVGVKALVFNNARDFRRRLGAESVDVVLLDWCLPDGTGLELLAWMRQSHEHLPVMFLTERSRETDVVAGLQAGADDYLLKPPRQNELRARLAAVLRRSGLVTGDAGQVMLPPYAIEPSRREVSVAGEIIKLTEREFDLALFLFRRPGRVVSRETLLANVWNVDTNVSTRTVDTHASRLRKKLKLDGSHGWQLTAVYQHGYRLERFTPR
jgi:DNA-binding response OmpR family regulator